MDFPFIRIRKARCRLPDQTMGTMEKSRSDPSVSRTAKGRLAVTEDPDHWHHHCLASPVYPAGPRWTISKSGMQEQKNARNTQTFKSRQTWIQARIKEKQWVPGPGSYKSEREFLLSGKDEVDTNHTIQEAAPNFSFQKDVKAANLTMREVQQKKNFSSYPSSFLSPGPGRYLAYTMFGAPSGGHKQAYLGGSAQHNWEKFPNLAK